MEKICTGHIDQVRLRWLDAHAVCVVAASFGYPRKTYRGDRITGLAEAVARDALVFHAGTRHIDDAYFTDGGRVLNVVAVRPSLAEAKEAAYQALSEIEFDGMQFRTDIADKELLRATK